MAQYKTHCRFNILIAFPLILLVIIYFFNPPFGLIGTFSISFIYSTLFMNPDLDLADKIHLFSLRGLLTIPFRGYSLIFRHRGISHIFVLGTLTRILWLGGLYFLVLYLFNKRISNSYNFLSICKSCYFLYGLSAIILADFCHLILDFKKRI
ncbi:MAG: DUF2227 family putative metal-binding protein [Parachlamydiales bacterium]|jgi:uncharacterized metal-binding protein